MESFAAYLNAYRVQDGELGLFWLGQAGFAFKDHEGALLAVDPYFSDCCNRYFGFRRLIPYLLTPYDVVFDGIVCTHAHYDHFDPDAIPQALANGRTRLFAACDCEAECERLHILENVTYIRPGDRENCCGYGITAVPCDHGPNTPDAVGLLIERAGRRIYIMGDTCLRRDYLENPLLQKPDVLILPINGAFGNLNEREAAEVCKTLKPKLAIPCHFGNFAEHGGNPGLYAEIMKSEAPDVAYRLMRVGEGILC